MKYIRTKDGIIKIDSEIEAELPAMIRIHTEEGKVREYRGKEIIRQANSIEELCDDFVSVSKYGITKLIGDIVSWNYVKTKARYDAEYIYGAIWTEHGLKYVAKMDEKGDLELL